MSCTFWNMRRRLRAQKHNEKIITDLATAQAAEKQEDKSVEKAVTGNDKRTGRKPKVGDSSN